MNVLVITPFDSSNYGAFLQAYCLKRKLESMGHTVAHRLRLLGRPHVEPCRESRACGERRQENKLRFPHDLTPSPGSPCRRRPSPSPS